MNLRTIGEILDIKEGLLKKYLKLLQDSCLVIKENFGKDKIFFRLTESGLHMLKFLESIYPIQKTDTKSLPIPI